MAAHFTSLGIFLPLSPPMSFQSPWQPNIHLLHHFTPSEQITTSLLHRFTPIGSPILTTFCGLAANFLQKFNRSEKIILSLSHHFKLPHPPSHSEQIQTLPTLNKLTPHSQISSTPLAAHITSHGAFLIFYLSHILYHFTPLGSPI